MEWIFGLPRGGLPYYLNSPESGIVLQEDICKLYCKGEFILVPTFKTYVDSMKIMEEVKDRKETDRSPRRPLTAFAPADGLYRYVFIPCGAAARALLKQLNLEPQSNEDLNGRVFPLDGKPCLEGSAKYPVFKCRAHPFSVSASANRAFLTRRGTPLTDQWHALARRIVEQWEQQLIQPPRWFVEEPTLGEDDSQLSSTEATGYCASAPEDDVCAKPLTVVAVYGGACEEHDSQRVDSWVNNVDPDAPDPNAPLPSEEYSKTTSIRTRQSLQRSPLKLRRSHRLRAKACPYASPSPDCCPHPPSPPRRVASALRYRDILRNPPAWAKRNGEFPTPTFSSNDWAYFSHRIALNAPAAT
ncbi:hypothetical protein BD626DRAFT_85065 [Schizophyllum amplum]|uniref:Uncharacterized protein n=1 Tax=Schizophyllum amplum TaxID=97359 RepID=A0A550C949_9AGAR|nr:hypothetical protein BD626DRAFT_85065 [Auriculariopsis ampla]